MPPSAVRGLVKYDKEAPLENDIKSAKEVKIMLSQHIGAPASACVKEGDTVKIGDVVATAANGLSVNIHASVEGTVKEVTDKFVLVQS